MLIKEYLKMAIDSIRSNKMRAFLTMLGIIIGISSVISIVATGDGLQHYMRSQFEAVGTNTVIVSLNKDEATDSDYITDTDIEALSEMGDFVRAATPQISGVATARFRKTSNTALIYGGTEGLEILGGVSMVNGSFFTESDNLSARNVCVIDTVLAQKFFGSTDVVGMEISLEFKDNLKNFQIIGVCKSPYGDMYMEGMPGTVYMPLSTGLSLMNEEARYNSVYLLSDSEKNNNLMGDTAVRVLEARHNNAGRNVYFKQNLSAQVDMINSMMGTVQSFIVVIAAISLLVGGIGVMNIMLVAVTERTREIGIRKSLGAKTNAILFQFLTESAIITLIGGTIGLVIGVIGAFVFTSFAGITPVFTPYTIGGSILFSAAVGIFFGIYPAKKAAQLSPIEALRHD